jgi:hypothetical protein
MGKYKKKVTLENWIKALTDGSHKKGTGSLCKYRRNGTPTYCCVGVHFDIYDNTKWREKERIFDGGKYSSDYGDVYHGGSSDELIEPFLRMSKGILKKFTEDDIMYLMNLNDKSKKLGRGQKYNFKFIAGEIQKIADHRRVGKEYHRVKDGCY